VLNIYLSGCGSFTADAALAGSFILSNSVPIYLSMSVWPQDLLVQLSCWPQKTKSSVHYRGR